MDNFSESFKKALGTAFEYGIKNVPVIFENGKPKFNSEKHRKQFSAACHRGYEKAQRYIFEYLKYNSLNNEISSDEKKYQELLMRKIIDGIAVTILGFKNHYIKRFSIHLKAPNLDLRTLESTLKFAESLNSKSRQNFSLVCDLTTIVHIGDLLRVDLRDKFSPVKLIELKSGKINEILLNKLKEYEPKPESFEELEKDSGIKNEYKAQAKRMLKQKIRMSQLGEILAEDKGTDPATQNKLLLSKEEYSTEFYHEFLNTIMNNAFSDGSCAGTLNYCLHIGVGYSENYNDAYNSAFKSIDYAFKKTVSKMPKSFSYTMNEFIEKIPPREMFLVGSMIDQNVFEVCQTPLTIWGISKDNLMRSINRKMCVLYLFDIVSFIWLAKEMGLNLFLSSRRVGGEHRNFIGSKRTITWGNRCLCHKFGGKVFILGGHFMARMLHDLEYPSHVIKNYINCPTPFEK